MLPLVPIGTSSLGEGGFAAAPTADGKRFILIYKAAQLCVIIP